MQIQSRSSAVHFGFFGPGHVVRDPYSGHKYLLLDKDYSKDINYKGKEDILVAAHLGGNLTSEKGAILMNDGSSVNGAVQAALGFKAGAYVKAKGVTCGGNAEVGSQTAIDDNLTCGGSAQLGEGSSVGGNLTCNGPASLGQHSSVKGDLTSTKGYARLGEGSSVEGVLHAAQGVSVDSNAKVKEIRSGQDVTVYPDSTISKIYAGGKVNIKSKSKFNGPETTQIDYIQAKGEISLPWKGRGGRVLRAHSDDKITQPVTLYSPSEALERHVSSFEFKNLGRDYSFEA